MTESVRVTKKDISMSEFKEVNMSGTVFQGVDLSNSRFSDINLRGAQFSAIDYGGASFCCMNTGEGRPQHPVRFEGVDFEGCTFKDGWFSKAKIVNCDLEGMMIDGVLVTEMIKAHRQLNGK